MKIKVRMTPYLHPGDEKNQSGIRRTIEAYVRYFPKYDIELVSENSNDYDLSVCHASANDRYVDVIHCHGLYWTSDYDASSWEWDTNQYLIEAIRYARVITVPSDWVAKSFCRDMRINPFVINHGIDAGEWRHNYENQGYVLWNKNRMGDVCDTNPMEILAERFSDVPFVSTFSSKLLSNIKVTGVINHADMKKAIQQSAVYLSTTKETFGIGSLEAMASGVPVLGFAHGGNLETIQHKVNGYLARPGDYDDLSVGLAYCLKHRDTLGKNGAELVKKFTWDKSLKIVRDAYEYALERKQEKPTVSIIVPVYNEAGTLERTLDSIVAQTYKPDMVVIVDDGSTDNSLDIAHKYADEYGFTVISQINKGVAHARNAGIKACNTKYVCCLDSDDYIKPDYLNACMKFLNKNQSVGIAYTALWYVMANGKEGLSTWPTDNPSYDDQLDGKNQIPTCCVFKREIWEKLGGYKQRYAPYGAGSEDAEFWLRAGAIGYEAAMATAEPLFVYSMGNGVTSEEGYEEVDWTEWQPYTKDRRHPFASIATPKRISHAVRQYDEPKVSVIIPVGKGHEELVIDALDSLDAQTYRKWEAIVVWDSPNKFEYPNAYPHVNFINVYNKKSKGSGYARNRGVDASKSDLILFLDADDYLIPDAIEEMLFAWQENEGIVYSDYYGLADVENVDKLEDSLKNRIVNRVGIKTLIKHRALDYDCELAQSQPPEDGEPYLWANITCLIPKKWHYSIGGFDEKMKSWEDVDYHFRMAREGYCYIRVEKPLLTYRFFSGSRREIGLDNIGFLVQYMREKYNNMKTKGCGSCGKNRVRPQMHVAGSTVNTNEVISEGSMKLNDSDFVKCRYASRNTGQHKVVGASTRTVYGYRSGGDIFLVHRDDIAVQQDLFLPIEGEIRQLSEDEENIVYAEDLEAPVEVKSDDKKAGKQRYSKSSEITALVEHDVPMKVVESLMVSGYMTVGEVKNATDTELLLIRGITKTKLRLIRNAVNMALETVD